MTGDGRVLERSVEEVMAIYGYGSNGRSNHEDQATESAS
jgi:hypothetical protein